MRSRANPQLYKRADGNAERHNMGELTHGPPARKERLSAQASRPGLVSRPRLCDAQIRNIGIGGVSGRPLGWGVVGQSRRRAILGDRHLVDERSHNSFLLEKLARARHQAPLEKANRGRRDQDSRGIRKAAHLLPLLDFPVAISIATCGVGRLVKPLPACLPRPAPLPAFDHWSPPRFRAVARSASVRRLLAQMCMPNN